MNVFKLAQANWEQTVTILGSVILFAACSPVDFAMGPESVGALGGPGGPGGTDKCYLGDSCNDGSPPPPPFAVDETITTKVTNKVDILVVIDNSGSMDTERAALGNRLRSFLDPLAGLDWRLCVTTSDVYVEKGQPMKFKNGAKYLSPLTTDAEAQFLDLLVNVAKGTGDEQPVKAQNLAFASPDSSCYRSDSALVSVSLTDEDERSTGGYGKYSGDNQFSELKPLNLPASVLDTVHATWGRQKVFSAHSIVIKSGDTACYDTQAAQNDHVYYGTRLEQLAALSDGKVGNICASDYSNQLQGIGNQVRTTTAALTLQCVPLSTPTVTLPPAYSSTQATQSGDKIYFTPELPAGVSVTLSYMCPGKI